MKKWILILAVTYTPFCVYAENATPPSCGENCTYTIENGVLTIQPIDETKSAKVQGYSRDCSNGCQTNAPWYGQDVTKIVIKEGITTIGSHAFEDMRTVTSLDLPEGLKTIGTQAFHDAPRLTKVNLPSSLTQLDSWAFGSSGIAEINIPEKLTTLNAYTFTNTKLTSIVIPANITNISSKAFYGDEGYRSTPLTEIYCSSEQMAMCKTAVANCGDAIQIKQYTQDSNGQYFYNNKWYTSANDMINNNHIKKRIYTVDEADKLSGKKNTFKIRYK